jgi:TPR repeat protein
MPMRRTTLAYANGKGVPQDYAEAVKWYRLAAEQGNAGAQFMLAHPCSIGRGIPRE